MAGSILLETTTSCNLNCTFCYRGEDKHHEINTCMSPEQVKDTFSKDTVCDDVSLVNKGEFFIHPDCLDIFDYGIKEAHHNPNLRSVFLYTNGTLLSHEKSDHILNTLSRFPVTFRLNFSLNAFSRDAYRKLPGKDLLREAVSNAEYFITTLSCKYPDLIYRTTVTVQSLVLEENCGELEDFVKRWQGFHRENALEYSVCEDSCISDTPFIIGLKRVYMGGEDDMPFYNKNIERLSRVFDICIDEQIEEGKDLFRRAACDFLFNQPVVGDEWVTICCRDLYFRHKYKKRGEDHSILGDYYRASHLLGFFENIGLCRDCMNYRRLKDSDVQRLNCPDGLKKMYLRRIRNGLPFDLYQIKGNKDQVVNYLDRTGEFVLVSEIRHKNILYNGHFPSPDKKTEDMCIHWIGNLTMRDGYIYAGCEKMRFTVDNISSFRDSLSNGDFSVLPPECITCSDKCVYDRFRDRFRIYGEGRFSSPVKKDKKYFDNIYMLKKHFACSDKEKILKFLYTNRTYLYWEEFVNCVISFEYDNVEFSEMILNQGNPFLVRRYAFFTTENLSAVYDWLAENGLSDNYIKLHLLRISRKTDDLKIIQKADDVRKIMRNQNLNEDQMHEFLIIERERLSDIDDISGFRDFCRENRKFLDCVEISEEFEYKVVGFLNKGMSDEISDIISIPELTRLIREKEFAPEILQDIILGILRSSEHPAEILEISDMCSEKLLNIAAYRLTDIFSECEEFPEIIREYAEVFERFPESTVADMLKILFRKFFASTLSFAVTGSSPEFRRRSHRLITDFIWNKYTSEGSDDTIRLLLEPEVLDFVADYDMSLMDKIAERLIDNPGKREYVVLFSVLYKKMPERFSSGFRTFLMRLSESEPYIALSALIDCRLMRPGESTEFIKVRTVMYRYIESDEFLEDSGHAVLLQSLYHDKSVMDMLYSYESDFMDFFIDRTIDLVPDSATLIFLSKSYALVKHEEKINHRMSELTKRICRGKDLKKTIGSYRYLLTHTDIRDEFLNRLTELPFSALNLPAFRKFLFVISELSDSDSIRYRLYSWYFDKNPLTALFLLKKIRTPMRFFDKDQYEKTLKHLDRRKRSVFSGFFRK